MSAADPAAEPAKGRRSLLVPALIAVLAGTGGAAAAFTQSDAIRQAVGGAPAGEAPAPAPTEYGEFVEMNTIVVNPRGTGGRRYLMVRVGVEAAEAKTLERLQVLTPAATDAVIDLLSGQTVGELSDIARRDSLKEGVRGRINEVLGEDGPVTRVYFTQYVLQ